MATLAPYSAKRTAMAWPMPELPPVTRTFLPARPGSRLVPGAAVGRGFVMVVAPRWWRSDCSCSGTERAGVTRHGLVLSRPGGELEQRVEEGLRERGERLDDVGQQIDRDLRPDGERGLLQPLAGLRAGRVGAGEALAVGDERQEAGPHVVGARVGRGARDLGEGDRGRHRPVGGADRGDLWV